MTQRSNWIKSGSLLSQQCSKPNNDRNKIYFYPLSPRDIDNTDDDADVGFIDDSGVGDMLQGCWW